MTCYHRKMLCCPLISSSLSYSPLFSSSIHHAIFIWKKETHLVAIKSCLPGHRVEGVVQKLVSYRCQIFELRIKIVFYIDFNIFIIEDTLHKIKKFLGQFFLGGCILILLEIQYVELKMILQGYPLHGLMN